jgi:predicted enzyme related to lactoylglutathione lyase
MATNLKIDYIEMPASDFDAVEAFYASVFNWTFEDFGDEYRAFSDGKIDGGFYISTNAASVDAGAPLIIFYADHLEEVESDVIAAGGVIVKPIFSFPGGRRFQFKDPHGNELAVWTHS